MNKKLLSESTSVPTQTDVKGRWSAVFITPGMGSSGEWTEEVLKRDGPHALQKGARCFVTHERYASGEPDPFRLWGTLVDDAHYEEGVGLVGEIDVLPSWRERVEEVAPHTALSVYLWADVDEVTREVTRVYEDITNGVDLVVFPGRENSGLVEKLYESAKPSSGKTPPTVAASVTQENKEGSVSVEKELTDALNTLREDFNAKFESLLAANKQELQAEVDADAIAEAKKEARAEFDAQASELAKAELLPSQEAALRADLLEGKDITKALESAKTVAKEAAELGASRGERHVETGRFVGGSKVEESANSDKDYEVKGLFR